MTSVKKAFDSGAIPASQSEHLSYAENFFGIRRYSSLASSEAKNPRRKNFRKIYAKPPLRLPRVGRFKMQSYYKSLEKTNKKGQMSS